MKHVYCHSHVTGSDPEYHVKMTKQVVKLSVENKKLYIDLIV